VNLRPRIKPFHESEYTLLIQVLKESRQRLGFLLCGYVLMPDHWHALIYSQYPLLLWQVLHDAKKLMTLRLRARRGSRGPFWQHPFWDRFVRNEREFHQRLEYMHMNPVRKGLVKQPEDWRCRVTTTSLSIRRPGRRARSKLTTCDSRWGIAPEKSPRSEKR